MPEQLPLIVVVDDDQDYLQMMADLVPLLGFQVLLHSYSAGAAALIAQTQPVLVILDLGLETQSAGLLVLEELWANPATSGITVVLASADIQTLRTQRQLLWAHGGDIMEKPFGLERLEATLMSFRAHAPAEARQAA